MSPRVYHVTTRSTVYRTYEVQAANEKDAVEKSVDAYPISEEDHNTETVSIRPASRATRVHKHT